MLSMEILLPIKIDIIMTLVVDIVTISAIMSFLSTSSMRLTITVTVSLGHSVSTVDSVLRLVGEMWPSVSMTGMLSL